MSTMDIEHDETWVGSFSSIIGNGNTARMANQLVMQEVIIDLEAVNDCKEMIEKEELRVKLIPPEKKKKQK